MSHKHIGTAHLLLGMLREEKTFAAQLLQEQGLTLDVVRAEVNKSEPSPTQGKLASTAGLDRWIKEVDAAGSIWTVKEERAGDRAIHLALYATDMPKQNENPQHVAAIEKLTEIQKRIDLAIVAMEAVE